MSIQLLSDETINKIAAGEVVERPLSVVKELVENSIDAGSTAVSIEIKDGGTSFIRITDNGSGINKSEVQKAFLRHATSKIKDANDLLFVSSLGFRGEALASIAAVSKVELISRTADSIAAVHYVIEGGKEVSFDEIGAPVGTTFIIRDLFFNTPARKKFLKTATTEGTYISEAVSKIALAHPEVSIHFISGGQTRLHTSGNGKLRDVIFSEYGKELVRDTLELKSSNECFGIYGFIGKPSLSRGNRNYEIFEVNGRTIRSELLTKAVEEAYQGFVMQHRYPVVILKLQVPFELIDVNVHPAKLEVRFSREEELFIFVRDSIIKTIRGSEIIIKDVEKDITEDVQRAANRAPEPFEVSRLENIGSPIEKPVFEANMAPDKVFDEPEYEIADEKPLPVSFLDNTKEEKPVQQELFEEKILSPESRPEFKLIGTLFDTYLLIEYKGDFLMIDQHAAHEKVLYERFMKAYENCQMTSQACNPPIVLSLSDRELAVLNDHMVDFKALGYEIEPFGGRDMAVYAVPGNMLSIAKEDLLIEMIDDLVADKLTGGERLIREKIAMMSCKAAVKGNMHLSLPEAEALIDELLMAENPYNCPHGRPTAILMSKYDIEKKFKRIV